MRLFLYFSSCLKLKPCKLISQNFSKNVESFEKILNLIVLHILIVTLIIFNLTLCTKLCGSLVENLSGFQKNNCLLKKNLEPFLFIIFSVIFVELFIF